MDNDTNYMEKLQALPEGTKRKVLVGTTIAIMIVVVYFWLSYFDNIFADLQQAPVAQTDTTGQVAPVAAAAPAAPATENAGFAQGMENSMAFIGDGFKNLFSDIAGIFQSPGQYNIQPKQ